MVLARSAAADLHRPFLSFVQVNVVRHHNVHEYKVGNIHITMFHPSHSLVHNYTQLGIQGETISLDTSNCFTQHASPFEENNIYLIQSWLLTLVLPDNVRSTYSSIFKSHYLKVHHDHIFIPLRLHPWHITETASCEIALARTTERAREAGSPRAPLSLHNALPGHPAPLARRACACAACRVCVVHASSKPWILPLTLTCGVMDSIQILF